MKEGGPNIDANNTFVDVNATEPVGEFPVNGTGTFDLGPQTGSNRPIMGGEAVDDMIDHDEENHEKDDHDKDDHDEGQHDKDDQDMHVHYEDGVNTHDKDDNEKPDHGRNETSEKSEHGMHDKPMDHSDDDWWYQEDVYPYASSTSTIALSIPTFIFTMLNK